MPIEINNSIQICRGFTTIQWKKLHKRLIKADGTNSEDQSAWYRAIEVFERRIEERFLSCIETLELADAKLDIQTEDESSELAPLPQNKGAIVPGLAIMALCCLLGETLQSFRQKTESSSHRATCSFPNGPCLKIPQTTTADAFKAFLQRPSFGNAFANEQTASSFIRVVRNGILHEAETRGWVILARGACGPNCRK